MRNGRIYNNEVQVQMQKKIWRDPRQDSVFVIVVVLLFQI